MAEGAILKGAAEQYRMAIRNAIRGLWSAAIDYDQFFDIMLTNVQQGLTAGWHQGAAECGIQPAELSPDERVALTQAIASESGYINQLAVDVEAGSKANGGKLGALWARSEVWINRFQDVVNRARVMACGDKKLIWQLGIAEHCSSCMKLDGKVKRASYWQQAGVQPQNPPNPMLECGGWNCKCSLTPTDAPASKGPLPRLP